MSYILDALKKSETERARRHAPGFADLPAGSRRRSGSRWALAFGILLAVNAVVVAALVLRPAPGEPATVAESREPALAAPTPEPVAVPVEPGANATADARPDSSSADADLAEPPADEPPLRVADATPLPTASEAPPPEPVREVAAPASAEARPAATPTLMELRVRGTLSLPELHLDIHVYSETPAERFVFINMSKYREGSNLAEGPRVRTIEPDGVVLEHRGTVFLLPRE